VIETFVSPSGVKTEMRVEDDGIVVKRTQRVDHIIDSLREQSETVNRKASGRIGARIPIETYMNWKAEWKRHHADRWEWKTFLVMRLNDADYKYLRNQTL
jgi:hypothetical protein